MKITIDIDCTPVEARVFLGLPDVQPMQTAWLAEVEKRMMAEAEKFSPEGLARMWLSGVPTNADWLPEMFRGLFGQGAGQDPASRETKNKPK
ncbi:DUF6489 family protein [Phreatobacter stygius]|uniref:Uncharacterized protein n=1 Tax=Phreatobacter stygius TaxID=1940610 RepID=A0A4D7AZN1_9HYPH|nr:DUF6489 family protein [Phreatobacter stygius]QCI64805.1 hypothetical protein E8M01_11565 [Phreatobacter stygius]